LEIKPKKIIEGNDECINNCSYINLFEYNGKCISECPNEEYFDEEDNIIKCKCELEKCLTCPTVALNNKLCTKCNDNYYPMENDPLNLGEYINCYNETPKGYYLDTQFSIFKKCYYTCDSCEIGGNNNLHNCVKCNAEYNFEIHINNYINCYMNCNYYYYFDNNNNFQCTKNFSCPPEYPNLNPDKKECTFEDIKAIENFINEILNIETNETNPKITKEEEINKYNQILEKIESIFTSDNFDLTNIDSGEDQVINANKMLITFTNTENQKNNLESNMSTIDLGKCELLLRNYYNLTNNQTIYLKKIDNSGWNKSEKSRI